MDFKVDYGGEILRFTVLFLKKNETVLVFSGIVIFHIQIIRLFQIIFFLINKAKKGTKKNKILRINLEDIFMTIKKGVVILTWFSKRNITNMLRKILDDDWEHKIC